MITFQNLLIDHQNRTSRIVDNYIAKYQELAEPKTLYNWNMFLMNNAKEVIGELTQSAIEVFRQAIIDEVALNKEDFNSIRSVNLGAAACYQEELRKLYETIVRTSKSQQMA